VLRESEFGAGRSMLFLPQMNADKRRWEIGNAFAHSIICITF
jgi:hypothetical protein